MQEKGWERVRKRKVGWRANTYGLHYSRDEKEHPIEHPFGEVIRIGEPAIGDPPRPSI